MHLPAIELYMRRNPKARIAVSTGNDMGGGVLFWAGVYDETQDPTCVASSIGQTSLREALLEVDADLAVDGVGR